MKKLKKSNYKEIIDNIEDYFIVEEGYNAINDGISPDRCPYLNMYGDNRTAIPNWMIGWSIAYRERANDGFSPAWHDGKGKVIGTRYDTKIKKLCGILND